MRLLLPEDPHVGHPGDAGRIDRPQDGPTDNHFASGTATPGDGDRPATATADA